MGISAENLNDFQRAYIESDPNANSRLLAPAGCGKTMTLLFRAAGLVGHLKEKGIGKPKILIATFTNPAKNELLKKAREFGFDTDCLEITTLNSWGSRILTASFPNTRIYVDTSKDEDINTWWKYVVRPCFDNCENICNQLEEKTKKGNPTIPTKNKRAVFEIFEGLKNLGLPLSEMKDTESFWEMQERQVERKLLLDDVFHDSFLSPMFKMFPGLRFKEDDGLFYYRPYDDRIKELVSLFHSSMKRQYSTSWQFIFSFEDQKYYPLQLLFEKKYDFEPYHYIFVDEFQDINALDFNLIKAISDYSKEKTGMGYVSVVGDADQAIFEWRDAVPDYIVNCSQYLDSLNTYQLTINYRSPANIVNLSQNLIANNKASYERQRVVPANSSTARIEIIKGEDVGEISRSLIPHLRELLKKGKTVAVIGRKKAQLVYHQMLFIKENIPFFAADDLNILFSESFNLMIDLFRFRLYGYSSKTISPGVFFSSIQKFVRAYQSEGDWKSGEDELKEMVYEKLPEEFTIQEFIDAILRDDYLSAVFSKSDVYLTDFFLSDTVSEAIRILRGGWRFKKEVPPSNNEDIFRKDPPFALLEEFADTFGSDFCGFVNRLQEVRDNAIRLSEICSKDYIYPPDTVNLMTGIRSKGREFDSVILLDAIEQIWPCVGPSGTIDNEEEERRMFYVAMTRSKEELLITLPKRYGYYGTTPSKYLREAGIIES